MYSIEELKNYENKILNMDCIDFLKNCPDNYFDLCCCDPPYGINVSRKNFFHGNLAKCNDYAVKEWDKIIPTKEVFDEIFRVSKNQIIFGGNYFVEYLKNSSCWLVWDKNNGNNGYADCELIYTSFKSAVRKYKWTWAGMLQQDMKHKEIRIHPTQKPVGLLKQILRDYYKEGIVFDCFSGSGSTAIACYDLNIPFVAIEKDYDYWKASVERLENAQAQLRLF